MRLTLSEAFEALGVAEDAPPELVRQSYRQLALRFHPDKNADADATATFQRVSAAYKRICDHRERQQKREAPSGVWPTDSPLFDASDDEFENGFGFEDDDLDDISLEGMLFMFQMMFGMPSGKKQTARSDAVSSRTVRTGKTAAPPHRPTSNQRAGGKAPGVPINIGGGRRGAKGKRQHKRSHGPRHAAGVDSDMARLEDEMARMFMADPFAFHVDELDSDEEDAEFVDLTRLLAMGGRPAMHRMFGAGRSSASDNNADKSTHQQRGEHEAKKASAPTSEHVASFNQTSDSNQDQSPLVVGTDVHVYGRLPGVIKFVGHVHYAKGQFVGVELRDAAGKNSGTIKGVRYFSCTPGHGLMVRPTDVTCALSA